MNQSVDLKTFLDNQIVANESILDICFRLAICLVVMAVVSWFYKNYSKSLGGKDHIGSILPLIGTTVFLVITVVKGSLALSLGLVGALSIVRFRTPIKEPEELGYLFLAIAVGLGLGAGFEIITLIVTFIILLHLRFAGSRSTSATSGGYTLVVECAASEISKIAIVLNSQVVAAKVLRMHTQGDRATNYYNVSLGEDFDIQELINSLKSIDDGVDLKVIESGVNW